MNVIEINNPSQNIVSNSFIEATLREGIEKLKKERIIKSDLQFEISVALIDKESIKGYNLEYRNAEKTTDVLSFCYEKTKTEIIGEMLLCLDVISEYAIEDGSDVLSEFRKNIIHSLLHIIGLEHGSKMFDLQDKLLEEINE
ncbi:rRNA maturation RNase YbeY [bacterium]|jgi:probable rRNA maturation factor|nr:rRNA maturation RNase YbeY [bacterium]MBT4251005.1 rRNA maturation RNase YbeY [bacterium]MBT4597763.1 rRNA maturation RNase YbeY [bacterium]MBT6753858.1 rRNA maturation RNase YbeY [bacterium]MBT7037430.1 rRNA maturation RNase YbeY [bacterium]